MAAAQLRSRQGDTVDALLWRELGLGSVDLAPIIAANPGLADAGELLPLGTVVTVTAAQAAPAAATVQLTQLWD